MAPSRSHGRYSPGRTGLVIMLVLVLLACGCTRQAALPPGTQTPGMPNPASVSCGQSGGTLEIQKDASGGEYGMCTFGNGTSCEEWALFRGEGCSPAVPAAPPAGGKKMVTFTEADNGKTGDITQNTRFAVELAENPTTGFMWNATLSPGLELQSSDFRQSAASPGMAGAGGTRIWIITARDPGEQTFSATYRRSWEPVTGNEKVFGVQIRVVSA